MKRSDLFVILAVAALLLPFFLFPSVLGAYKAINTEHAYAASFIKFAILATFGESIGLRIRSGRYWHKGFGLIPRALVWGFLGALATTSLLGVAMDVLGVKTPLPQVHAIKVLGNVSAVLLVAGAVWLLVHRVTSRDAAGRSRAFDSFFLAVVVLVIFTGVGAELGRLALSARAALGLYVLHLGMVLALFLTFPFSKFAHALYRTLAMAHQRLTSERSRS